MADFRIGNSQIAFDEVRKIKSDVQLDDALKNRLSKDGLDEVIFQQGDEMFIGYRNNADFDNLKLNMDVNNFSIDDAFNPGQLSVDGDAVQVLFVDDENKDSFWVSPFKSFGNGVKSLVNNPHGKAALLGFAGGVATVVAGRNLNWGTNGSYSNPQALNPSQRKAFQAVAIGAPAGTVIGGLKGGAEAGGGGGNTFSAIAAGAGGFGAGALVGWGGDIVAKAAKSNPKVAAMAGGVTLAVVGTGIALDLLSDNGKPANYRAINQITEKPGQ